MLECVIFIVPSRSSVNKRITSTSYFLNFLAALIVNFNKLLIKQWCWETRVFILWFAQCHTPQLIEPWRSIQCIMGKKKKIFSKIHLRGISHIIWPLAWPWPGWHKNRDLSPVLSLIASASGKPHSCWVPHCHYHKLEEPGSWPFPGSLAFEVMLNSPFVLRGRKSLDSGPCPTSY